MHYLCIMKKNVSRIEREKKIVSLMIRLYCRHVEHHAQLCDSCRSLMEYACQRLERCSFGEEKKACRRCPVRCYKPAMREKMRLVMRTIGPRMIFYAPMETLRHWLNL